MTQQPITITLSIDEINLILEGLGELPFRRVFEVIGHIQNQARAQIEPGADVDTTLSPQETEASMEEAE